MTSVAASDLIGEWHRDDRAASSFSSSTYDGSGAALGAGVFTIDPKGHVTYRSVGVQNGKEVREEGTGSASISGANLELRTRPKGPIRFVITGLHGAGTVTILRLLPAQVEPTEANVRSYAQYWLRAKH